MTCSAHRLNTIFTDTWKDSIADCQDIADLEKSINSLMTNIQHKADIQKLLPVKIKTGSQTRVWRGLKDRLERVLKDYDTLGGIDSVKKYIFRLDKQVLENMYNLIDKPIKMFDVLEKSDASSLNYVAPVFYGLKKLFSATHQDESYVKLFKEKFISRLNQKFFLKDIHYTSTFLDPN